MKLMRDVPIVGWDVAFTDKGVYLLEVSAYECCSMCILTI